MRSRVDQLLIGLNVIVGAALLFFLFAPGGMVTAPVAAWSGRRAHARYASAHWTDLVNGAARLDRGRGPVRVVVFSDYECPYCRRLDQALAEVLAADSTLGVALRHFPLGSHPSAERGARGAWCAMQQGRFPQMHHALFFSTSWLSDTTWRSSTDAVGIPDPSAFIDCVRSDSSERAILRDVAYGDSLGVSVTPTLVVDGKLVEGALTASQLSDLLHRNDRQ